MHMYTMLCRIVHVGLFAVSSGTMRPFAIACNMYLETCVCTHVHVYIFSRYKVVHRAISTHIWVC